MAVVFSSFSEADKKKFRKLFCHKRFATRTLTSVCMGLVLEVLVIDCRDALNRAFNILSHDPKSPDLLIQFHDFVLFMSYYKPRMREFFYPLPY